MRPVRDRTRYTPLWQPTRPAELVPVRRRHPGIWAAAAVILPARVLRRRAREALAVVTVAVAVAAGMLVAVSHTTVAQLSPPSPPTVVCGNSTLLNGPSSPPGGAVTVPAGDNSAVNFSTPGATYWFASGTHTLGTGLFSQIQPGNNSTFTGAPGAVIDGQGLNQFAFVSDATGVTVEFLTIQNFIPPGSQGAVNQNAAPNWTISNNTIQDNVPGAGMMLGTSDVVTTNCVTQNGEYAFNAFSTNHTSPLTGGPSNLTLTGNEFSFNNTCNWEDITGFPITPPAGCTGAGQFLGCGCSGGGKFWATDGGVFDNNYVHDNYSVGVWWDTNNTGWQINGNYISGSFADGLVYEISYNAQMDNNTFVENALGSGPRNSGFPDSAIYISESGSDLRVPGPYGAQLQIENNGFYDNWGGVILWENANRYCSSIANTSTGYCTLVNRTPPTGPAPKGAAPRGRAWRRGHPGPGRVYGVFNAGMPVISVATCSLQQYLTVTPWFDDCRWKTQNVLVSGNLFDFTAADLGASCTVVNFCGFNGVFSEFGSFPPYTGTVVENNITFHQNNLFSANTYCGPWGFDALEQGNQYSFATWQAAPYNQDPGSTLNSAVCAPQPAPGIPVPRAPVPRPVTIPVRSGRR